MSTTLTSSAIANSTPPRAVHAGVFAKTVKYFAGGTTISASMLIQMMYVPVGLIVDDVILAGNSGAAGAVCSVGDGGDDDRYISGVTLSANSVHRMSNALGAGHRISKSDDAVPYYDTMAIKVQALTTTTTGTYILTVLGHMEPA